MFDRLLHRSTFDGLNDATREGKAQFCDISEGPVWAAWGGKKEKEKERLTEL